MRNCPWCVKLTSLVRKVWDSQGAWAGIGIKYHIFLSYTCTEYWIFFVYCVGDVDGSIEAINDALQTYNSRKISLNVLCAEVGAVSENDIKLADTFKGKFI